jgi:hypothetical protein
MSIVEAMEHIGFDCMIALATCGCSQEHPQLKIRTAETMRLARAF